MTTSTITVHTDVKTVCSVCKKKKLSIPFRGFTLESLSLGNIATFFKKTIARRGWLLKDDSEQTVCPDCQHTAKQQEEAA